MSGQDNADHLPEPANRLAAYGTLQPGESNHDQLAEIDGVWLAATVRGHFWLWESGPYEGLPAFRRALDGEDVPVTVLLSDDLGHHWARLDAFEGPGYERVMATVTLIDEQGKRVGPLAAQLYEARTDDPNELTSRW
ncbi:MAG: gamma-glutamylcyclotransferase family protein [Actinomycetota bacterium]